MKITKTRNQKENAIIQMMTKGGYERALQKKGHFIDKHEILVEPVLSHEELKQRNQEWSQTRIFIYNIPFDLGKRALKRIFGSYGPVKSIYILQHEEGENNRMNNHGFVTYKHKEVAERILKRNCIYLKRVNQFILLAPFNKKTNFNELMKKNTVPEDLHNKIESRTSKLQVGLVPTKRGKKQMPQSIMKSKIHQRKNFLKENILENLGTNPNLGHYKSKKKQHDFSKPNRISEGGRKTSTSQKYGKITSPNMKVPDTENFTPNSNGISRKELALFKIWRGQFQTKLSEEEQLSGYLTSPCLVQLTQANHHVSNLRLNGIVNPSS